MQSGIWGLSNPSQKLLTVEVLAEQTVIGTAPEQRSDEGEAASSSGSDDDYDGQEAATADARPSSSGFGLPQDLGEADRELLESIQSRGDHQACFLC